MVAGMTEDEARMVQKYARMRGLDGEAAPVDQDAPAGEWRLYRESAGGRTDVTAEMVAALKAAAERPAPAPVRGFVLR